MLNFVIVGGGISGYSCCQKIIEIVENDIELYGNLKVICVTTDRLIKVARKINTIGHLIENYSIDTFDIEKLNKDIKIEFIKSKVEFVDTKNKTIHLTDSRHVLYYKICICTGAISKIPRELIGINSRSQYSINRIIKLRDDNDIKFFEDIINKSKSICILGNGGIALDVLYLLRNTNIKLSLVAKEKHLGAAYFDENMGQFLMEHLMNNENMNTETEIKQKSFHFETKNESKSEQMSGCSLGPYWSHKVMVPCHRVEDKSENYKNNIEFYFDSVVTKIKCLEDHVVITTNNDRNIVCDYLLIAIGVHSNNSIKFSEEIAINNQNSYIVNFNMETSIKDVYAAGDCCFLDLESNNYNLNDHLWFQRFLWSQAVVMGSFAGECMLNSIDPNLKAEPLDLPINFDLFTHITVIFGLKIVMLGRYKTIADCEILIKQVVNQEYSRVVIDKSNRIVGCILIGNIKMTETIENLILNQLDVSSFKEHLLEDSIDIEDFFD